MLAFQQVAENALIVSKAINFLQRQM